VLLANLHFLFWLSLIPFVIRWVGEAGITRDTVLAFGVIMLLSATSFALLRAALLAANDARHPMAKTAPRRWPASRGVVTLLAYVLAILIAFLSPGISIIIYVAVALMWLVPARPGEEFLE
jgi:uncharacterized membrane protein